MRKPKMFGIRALLLLLWLGCSIAADGTFEDADRLNDYNSGNSNQHFDLRHTIPGEPEVDYPIYSEVPPTSFECTGRHEGYYADVESRCQAFRICAHTARSVHGFGFLCPNGTLFSQKNFVCDWYRNVNCDESEQYYSKNDVNRIGSSSDMMEQVRQMMEYPMKTISKALHRGGNGAARRANSTQSAHHTLKKQLKGASAEAAEENTASRGRNVHRGSSRKQAVTRAQVESVKSYNRKEDVSSSSNKFSKQKTTQDTVDDASGGNVQSTQTSKQQTLELKTAATDAADAGHDVYVNSLGELSTDPGVSFDRSNARIIAEAPRAYEYGKKLNFAEKVNAGLNDLADLPPAQDDALAPDYVKNIRKSTDEATQTDLVSNINGLLDEIAYDLDPSVSGYQIPTPQKAKHTFKFLSRGFTSQSERAKNPYLYGKPKQTASTIRFSPNELPVEDKDTIATKTQKHTDVDTTTNTNTDNTNTNTNTNTNASADVNVTAHTFENSAETIQFTFMTTTPQAPAVESSATVADNYLSAATLPPQEDYSYLSPPLLEPLLPPPAEVVDVNAENAYDVEAQATVKPPEVPSTETATLSETTAAPIYAPYIGTTTTTPTTSATTSPADYVDGVTTLATRNESEQGAVPPTAVSADAQDGRDAAALALKEQQQFDVAQHAANLLLAGVKLTAHDNSTEYEVSTAEAASSSAGGELLIQVVDEPLDTLLYTSTEYAPPTTVTPAPAPLSSSTESGSFSERIRNYRRFATLQRATARPLLYTKRAQQPNSGGKSATTKPLSSSTASTTTTRSYLKRVAASRLRLSRLAAGNRGTTADNNTNSNSSSSNDNNAESSESSKKIAVRNIDKELGTSGKGYDSRPNAFDSHDAQQHGAPSWESVRNSLKRYQVSRKPSQAHTTTAPTTTTRHALLRSRNRYAKFKSQRGGSKESANSTTTAAPYISIEAATAPPASPALPAPSQQQPQQQQRQQHAQTNSPTQHNNSNNNHPHIQKSVSTSVSYSTSSASASKSHTHSDSNTLTDSSLSSITSSAPSSTFLSFDKLTRAIVDDSVLQNFKGSYRPSSSVNYQSAQRNVPALGNTIVPTVRPTVSNGALGFGQVQPQAPAHHAAPQRPLFLPPVPTIPPTVVVPPAPTPRVLIARAEGQRIEPNSVSSIISALVTQKPKTTQATPYVPLDDFLTKKFGGGTATQSYQRPTTSSIFAQLQQQQQQQNQFQQQQQQQQQYQQQARNYPKVATTVLTPQPQHQLATTTATTYSTQQQQQLQQHLQKITATHQQSQVYQQVPTTATTYLAQQQQQQQQEYQRQQYQQQQSTQQQHFQATAATYLTQQNAQKQTYSTAQQQQSLRQQQQQQQSYYQTSTTNVAQQQQPVRQEQQQQQLQQQSYYQTSSTAAATQQPARQQQQQQQTYYQTSSTAAATLQQQQQQAYLPPLPQKQTQPQQVPSPTTAIQFSYPQQSQQQQLQEEQHQSQPQQQQQYTQQPSNSASIFTTFQQPQQQLPQFPPLSTSIGPTLPTATTPIQDTPGGIPPEHDVHLNVQLPALPTGLIPAPTTLALDDDSSHIQAAQKRIDLATPTSAYSGYSGASSYDVPLSSIGRLPNDISNELRRLRKF